MKIKMQGSELKKVDIDFLSLVKRGANRAPFKVIKAEDQVTASLDKTGLIGAVQKFFSLSQPAPQVVAVFVEKSAIEKSLPNLAEAGFELKNYETQDDVAIFKQEGFDECTDVIMIKSEGTVGFAIGNVSDYSDLFCGSLSFDPSVAQTGFYPGLNEAMKAMQVAVNVSKGDSTETLRAFTIYSEQLSKAIPESVWKFESLQRGFGGGTTTDSDVVKTASALAETILKGPFNGGTKTGAHAQANKETGSSSDQENGNSGTTSELPGSEDDSTDTEAARKARMAKGATDLTSSETVGEDKARKANGTDTSMAKAAQSTTTTEGDGMSSTTTTEVEKSYRPKIFKDADGKEYVQAIDQKTGLVEKYTPGAKIPEGKTTMTEEWMQDGSDGNFGNENGQGKGKAYASESADDEVHHTGAGGDKGNMDGTTAAGSMKKAELDALLAAVATIPDTLKGIVKSVAEQGELLKKTTERLEAVEKTAATAVKKAEGVVVHVGTNYDSAFENLGGGQRRVIKRDMRTAEQIKKAEYPEELWTGALGVVETHIPGVEEA